MVDAPSDMVRAVDVPPDVTVEKISRESVLQTKINFEKYSRTSKKQN